MQSTVPKAGNKILPSFASEAPQYEYCPTSAFWIPRTCCQNKKDRRELRYQPYQVERDSIRTHKLSIEPSLCSDGCVPESCLDFKKRAPSMDIHTTTTTATTTNRVFLQIFSKKPPGHQKKNVKSRHKLSCRKNKLW